MRSGLTCEKGQSSDRDVLRLRVDFQLQVSIEENLALELGHQGTALAKPGIDKSNVSTSEFDLKDDGVCLYVRVTVRLQGVVTVLSPDVMVPTEAVQSSRHLLHISMTTSFHTLLLYKDTCSDGTVTVPSLWS